MRNKIILTFWVLTFLFFIISPASAEEKQNQNLTPRARPSDKLKTLSLDQCIELAIQSHPQLKSYVALKRAAQGRIVQAQSAYFPQIGFSSSYNTSDNENNVTVDGIPLPQDKSKATESYSNTFSLSQNIYDFGRTKYRLIAARENLNSATYDFLIAADGIIYDIKNAYFKALALEKAVIVHKQAVNQRQLQLKYATGFYELGKRSKIEVTKAEVDLANAKLDLIKAENMLMLAKVDLANAIGITDDIDFSLDDKTVMPEIEMTIAQALEAARNNRPEMLKLACQERAGEANLGLARASYYPSIDASGNFGWRGNRLNTQTKAWSWGITFRMDVLTWGKRTGSVTEQEEQLNSLRDIKERTWQNISKEVQYAFIAKNEAKAKVSVLEKALESARDNLRLAQGRYEQGLSSFLEYGDAQLAFQNAGNNLISAVLDYQISLAKLEQATGVSAYKDELIKKITQK